VIDLSKIASLKDGDMTKHTVNERKSHTHTMLATRIRSLYLAPKPHDEVLMRHGGCYLGPGIDKPT
jgi:hypothetical protein